MTDAQEPDVTATFVGVGRQRTLEDGRVARHGEPVPVDVDLGRRLSRQATAWKVDGLPPEGPATDKVDDVKDWVGDDVDRARTALDAELAKDDKDRRSSLVSHLEQLLDPPSDDGDAAGIADEKE